MIGFWVELILLIIGYGACALLFWRIPRLPRVGVVENPSVSVVIPARNEEKTLPLLLKDLSAQTLNPIEIIVADDGSEDSTAQIAREFGATLVSPQDKPDGWIGKSWACQHGALAAKGETLIFLDADVRLANDGLARIVSAFQTRGTISVQPYHSVCRAYEHLALIFNLIQIGANGTSLPNPVNLGLFGPVIAMSRKNYFDIGGHASVKSAIVEDMELAEHLRQAQIPFSVFVGDVDVSFRMYPAGFRTLWHGFTKNLATGAAKTPAILFLLVALMISSVTSAALHLILSTVRGEPIVFLYAVLYALWAVILGLLGKKIGRFSPLAAILYPLPLAMFLLVFMYSGFLRLFRQKVIWKGRAIKLER